MQTMNWDEQSSSMVGIHTMKFKYETLSKKGIKFALERTIERFFTKRIMNMESTQRIQCNYFYFEKKHHTHHIVNWLILGWHNQSYWTKVLLILVYHYPDDK